MKGFQGQRGGPKHTGPSWSVSRGIGRENNGVWGDSGVTVSGVLDFKKQRRWKRMKDGSFGMRSIMNWECSGVS